MALRFRLAPLLMLVIWLWSISGIRMDAMNDLGLVSVLPVAVFVLLGFLTVSFGLVLRRRPFDGAAALLHVVALITMLYSITALVQSEPRFSSTYRHAGIIDFIQTTGSFDPNIDAYFSWPGLFAFGALLNEAAGLDSSLSIAAWAPLFLNLLYLPPLLVILRWATDDRRLVWLSAWFFYSLNWVGQDYFSPQGLSFGLWLCLLAIALRWLVPRPEPLPDGHHLRALVRTAWTNLPWTGRHDEPATAPATWQMAGAAALVVVVYAAVVSGHQLTPVTMVLTLAGLVVMARFRLRWLPILMTVVLAGWISYMTTRYLVGHYGVLSEPVGRVGGNLTESVAKRTSGSADHLFVVSTRTRTSLIIWLVAALGFVRHLRAGRAELAFLVVGLAPFALPVLQPYGGEIFLRVFLFVLPVVAFYVAAAVLPDPHTAVRRRTVLGFVVLAWLLLAVFQITRYGNERMDHFTPGDVAAVEALYRVAPVGSTIFAGNDNLPWRAVRYADHRYVFVTETTSWEADGDAEAIVEDLRISFPETGSYVIVTRSNIVSAELFHGRPGSLEGVVEALAAAPDIRNLYRTDDGAIFFVPPQDVER